ncbi:hypothetical protein HYPSUDRAFT_50917 [Hypholoma sublateritium FD-334 SS-4]|uniref:Pinin/SDK/MemA protein domain-containing protein n=1 Tax=Hypholoma sublateritium (strain FD-334 SS-4) TaxID=945553 RepID=A0A0D2LLD9_HYPSF|nr:hypothetical protein HYPSUDRAFT_50917 [Hypholoma sublateritium FD-334 SS-4]
MSSTEVTQNEPQVEVPTSPTEPTHVGGETRKRPRLDFSAALGGRERKRGKSMFGILVGTLNKAKNEDKERNASEAAKKRQLIEQRLQAKLRKETDSVRRAEDAKKDKTAANRKEEDLQLKDSIYKLRRTRLPILANFLLTSDTIPDDSSSPPPADNPLAPVPRSHPPPLYYLPAILTPAQEAFLARRKAEVSEAAEKEWELFSEERSTGIEEVNQLRQRVAEEEARRKNDKAPQQVEVEMAHDDDAPASAVTDAAGPQTKGVEMDVDDAPAAPSSKEQSKSAPPEGEKKDESAAMPADDDDAVEY